MRACQNLDLRIFAATCPNWKGGRIRRRSWKGFFPLLHRRGIILFIRSQKLLSFRRIHKSSDCWQVSWIKYGSLNILILLHVNSSWYKYFLEIWIWIWKWNLGNVFCENSTCYIISSCTGIYWDFLLTQQLNVTWMWPKILKTFSAVCEYYGVLDQIMEYPIPQNRKRGTRQTCLLIISQNLKYFSSSKHF